MISIIPIPQSIPLMAADGKKLLSIPALITPSNTCISPAIRMASNNKLYDPKSASETAITLVKPAAGPVTESRELLMEPTTIPPIIPANKPEIKFGALDAMATPKHKGNATKKTTRPALRSLKKDVLNMFN